RFEPGEAVEPLPVARRFLRCLFEFEFAQSHDRWSFSYKLFRNSDGPGVQGHPCPWQTRYASTASPMLGMIVTSSSFVMTRPALCIFGSLSMSSLRTALMA